MFLKEDVEDDLMEAYSEYYSKEASVLVYQNGRDGQKFMVEIKVYPL